MKKQLVGLILSCAVGLTASGQHTFEDNNLIRNNTGNEGTTISFQENIGADLYTGKLKAGIELFSYKSSGTGLHHSVAIQYDGGGNLVDRRSSNIGLNWQLDAGGIIYREMNGGPDEDQNGFTNLVPVPTNGSFTNAYVTDNLSGTIDAEFDVFHFNAGGVSGRFIIGNNGQIQTIPSTNITVEYVWLNQSGFSAPLDSCERKGFILTLEDGTKYYYNNFDCRKYNFANNQKRYASSTWNLSKIVSAFRRDSVVFNYEPYIEEVIDPSLGYYSYVYAISGQTLQLNGSFPNDGGPKAKTRNMRLSWINYPDGTTINFNYGYKRLDLNTDKVLRSIEIIKNGAVYGYQMVQSYMGRPNGTSVSDVTYQDYENTSLWNQSYEEQYSLQLDSLYKYSGQQTLHGYGFKYNTQQLPPILCDRAVDAWGYYNGNTQDMRQQPYFDFGGLHTAIGGIRSANIQYAIARSLEKVRLPAGGTVRFVYEAHTTKSSITPNDLGLSSISSVGGLRIKQVVYSDGTGQTNDMVRSYQYLETDGTTSSGVMANFPRFGYLMTEDPSANVSNDIPGLETIGTVGSNQGWNLPYALSTFLVRNGNQFNYPIYTQNSVVGYGRVIEYQGTFTKYKSKAVYTFSTSSDYPVSSSLVENDFPYPYIPDNDFAWGLPLSTEKYNTAGLLLSKTQRYYDVYTHELNNDNFRAVKIGLKSWPFQSSSDYAYRYYYPVTGKVFPSKTVNTAYLPNGSVKDSLLYTFDTAYNVLRYTIARNADGDMMKTLYYYPYDFDTNSIPAVRALRRNNDRCTFPLRTEIWKISGANQRLMDVSVAALGTYNGTFTGSPSVFTGIVKPAASYNFTPDQAVSNTMWGTFNSTVLLPNTQYFTQTATLDNYDDNGNLLQATVKGKTTTSLYDATRQHAVANIANAPLASVAYSSFEDTALGGWTAAGLQPSVSMPANFVTGSYGYAMINNNLLKSGLDATKKYTITVWVKSGSPKITTYTSGSSSTVITPVASDTHQGWQLYKVDFTGAVQVSVGAANGQTTVIDELRLYPSAAAMTTATYDPLWGTVTSQCDAANHVIYYLYDQFGRLRFAKDADGNIRKAIDRQQQDPQF